MAGDAPSAVCYNNPILHTIIGLRRDRRCIRRTVSPWNCLRIILLPLVGQWTGAGCRDSESSCLAGEHCSIGRLISDYRRGRRSGRRRGGWWWRGRCRRWRWGGSRGRWSRRCRWRGCRCWCWRRRRRRTWCRRGRRAARDRIAYLARGEAFDFRGIVGGDGEEIGGSGREVRNGPSNNIPNIGRLRAAPTNCREGRDSPLYPAPDSDSRRG